MTLPLAVIDWHAFFFLLFALLACGFGIAVVASSNIVRMAFYLTLSLGATGGLFFLAGAQFLGAMQFLIYVGGTLVLLIFGVMLTAQSRFITMKTAAGEWIASGVLGAALLLLLVRGALSVDTWREPHPNRDRVTVADTENTAAIGLGLVGVRVDKLPDEEAAARGVKSPPSPLANSLSGYLFPFVIVSMHLLVVLIGAGYLARTRSTVPAARPRVRAATAPRTDRKHSFLVKVGIVKGMILNAVLVLLALSLPLWTSRLGAETGSPAAERIYQLGQVTPPWLPVALAALFGLNILLLYVVWHWQKWGALWLLAVPVLLLAVIAASPWGVLWGAVAAAVMMVPAAALLVLLLRGGPRSAWSEME